MIEVDAMNNLQRHFQREVDIMRKSVDEDDQLIIEPYINDIHKLLETFGNEGHSGASAPLAASVIAQTIKAVLGFQILSPLTGSDDEWNDISEIHGSSLWQNNRDSAVFKNADGTCSYSNAIVWVGQDEWDRFTGSLNGIGSLHYIKEFPFMPKTFYVNVQRELYDPNNPEHEQYNKVDTGHGLMVYKITDPTQLEQVFNYYNQKTNEKSV